MKAKQGNENKIMVHASSKNKTLGYVQVRQKTSMLTYPPEFFGLTSLDIPMLPLSPAVPSNALIPPGPAKRFLPVVSHVTAAMTPITPIAADV